MTYEIRKPTEGESVLIQDAYHVIVVLGELRQRVRNNSNKYATHDAAAELFGMLTAQIEEAEAVLEGIAAYLEGERA